MQDASIIPTPPIISNTDPPVGQVLSQALPTAVIQQADAVQAQQPPVARSAGVKEHAPVMSVDRAVELPSGVQSVEELRTPEIPLDVEKYIQEVKDHTQELPAEIVVADQSTVSTPPVTLAKPVIVLPMTEQEFHSAQKAPVGESRRWLGTWIKKITQMFFGEVVFKDEKR